MIVQKAPLAFLLLLALLAIFVFPPGSQGAGSFYLSVAFLAAAFIAASVKTTGMPRTLEYLRLSPKKNKPLSLVLLGIALALASFILTAALSVILGWLGIYDADLVAQKVLSFPLPVLMLAFTMVPIGEELFFRGFLFRQITDLFPKIRLPFPAWLFGALFSSIIFSSTHILYGSKAELVVAFSIGFLFCIATQRKNSLIPAIVAHAFYNLFSIVFMVFL